MKTISHLARNFIAMLVAIGATNALSQTLDDSWVWAGMTTDGTEFFFHRESLNQQGFPPSKVSANILSQKNNKSNGYQRWTFFCQSKQIVIDSGNPIDLPIGENSLRNFWLNGFCGVTNDKGAWYYVGSFKDGSMMTSYFIDSTSIRKTNQSEKNGVYFKIAPGIFEHSRTQLRIEKIFEIITPCNGYSVAEMREIGNAEYVNQSIVKNVPGDSALQLICKNHFPINSTATQKNNSLSDSGSNISESAEISEKISKEKEDTQTEKEKINQAKSKCKDLGFKEKTEKFGACVLRLSK